MKKMIACVVLVCMVISLTSCINWIQGWPLPYGIWHSEELNMTLFIDSELSLMGDGISTGAFTGMYVHDDEKINIIVVIEGKGNHISIHNYAVEWRNSSENLLFFGGYRVEGDRLYFEVDRDYSEPIDMDAIIFEQMEQAELIRWFLSVID